MKKDKKILLIDIDDVLWDMMPVWCAEYNNTFNADIKPKDFHCWDVSKVVGKDNLDNFKSILERPIFWDKVYVFQDSETLFKTVKLLKKLTKLYNVYICTATEYFHTYKLDLFLNIFDFISNDNLVLMKDKWLINADIVIDDNDYNLRNFPDTTRVIKINKPWNEDFNCESYSHFNFAALTLIEEV